MIALSNGLRLFSLILPFLCPQIGWTENLHKEHEHTAQLLTNLLNAGRVVVEQNQTLINDPSRGDKEFTPEVFERLLREEFFQQTHIDLKHPPSSLTSLAK